MYFNEQPQPKNINRQGPNEILYKQTFQCSCSQIFNTLDEYQCHIENHNHDSYRLGLNNGEPGHKQTFHHLPMTQSINQMPNSALSNLLNFNLDDQQISFLSKPNPLFQRNLQNSTYFGQKSYQNQCDQFQQPIYRTFQQQFTRQSQVQQKQQSFKYIQAYYQTKLAPFYRQFDIDPKKSVANKKLAFQTGDLHTSSSKKFIKLKVSTKFTRSDAINDLNKILEELSVRMIPVENSIIEFIYIFTCENFQKITQIKEEDLQKVEQNLQESLNKLTVICYNRKAFSQNNNYFMETDVDFVIRTFLEFLKEFLRQNQLWIAHLMLIPIVQSMIKFHQEINDENGENLKLIDVPCFLSFIKTKELRTENFPIQVESQKISQFLIWFTQWFTMIQFVKNKWSIDYIEPLYDQINHINHIYQDNVQKYQRYALNKKFQFMKRSKRKIIEKEKKKFKNSNRRKRQLNQLMKFSNNINVYPLIGDINFQSIKENKQQQSSKQLRKKDVLNSSYFNSQTEELVQNGRNIGEELVQKRNQPNQYEKDSVAKQKRIYRSILQEQNLNSQINSLEGSDKDDFDDDEMKEAYISAFRSQYVSYFSPESVEARRKEEEIWMQRLQKLKKILKNPNNFKLQIYSQVSRQLQDVDELIGLVRIDFRLFNSYQQQILKRIANTKFFIVNENEKNLQPDLIKKQKIANKRHSQSYDPFIIQKNFRSRNTKNQFSGKEIDESSESQKKIVQENTDKIQVKQKIDSQNEQEKQSQNQKYSEKILDEVQRQNFHEGQVSNEFLDEFL